jgi:hypothetical protein
LDARGLGFEAEILYPVQLLGGIGNEHAAGVGDAAKGVVGGEAFATQERREKERGSADARPAVGHDASPLE